MGIFEQIDDLSRPPVIIAEIGINHGGSLDVAKRMAELVAESGIKVFKHQTHFIDDEMSNEAKRMDVGYLGESIYSLMERCALDRDEEVALKEFVEGLGLVYMSTPFSRSAADFLNDLGVEQFKIGSGECNNFPLVRHIAAFGKPVILSTGMNDLMTVSKTVSILKQADVRACLLHTTNIYPTPPHLVRLNAMNLLFNEFEMPVGLSDHTCSNMACLVATGMGARVLERHFTDSKNRSGPDISNSMDPDEASALVTLTREVHSMLGDKKSCLDEERPVAEFAFASVVSSRSINAGEKFTSENLWVRRPAGGDFNASHYEDLLGCTASKDIASNVQIKNEDVTRA